MRRILLLLLAFAFAACAAPVKPVTITLDALPPARALPATFLGFSYETAQLLPRADGTHYFSPANRPLVAMFKTLGIKSLRVGGNSVDSAKIPIPAESDVDSLFEFARAAGVKVIYSVRLQEGDPQSAARFARHIQERYSDALDCFAVGNEPAYFKTYEAYHDKWKAIVDAMRAAAPGARFCAPDTNPNAPWCKNLVRDFGASGWFTLITEHDYPGGCSYKNPGVANLADLIPQVPAASREKMLSNNWYPRYEMVRKTMTDAIAGTPLPYRLSETNSYWYGGLKDASDTFASALWSADYLCWWAAHGAAGLNFHTGDKVGGGDKSVQSRYTAFVTDGPGFDVHPLSYGIKLFDLGARGALVPLAIADAQNPQLSAYAASQEDSLSIILINRRHGPAAANSRLRFQLPPRSSAARILFLTAPHGDIAAKTGLLLGGQPISPTGQWSGHWTPLSIDHDSITLELPPATAAVLQVQTSPH
jgi:hypothetical protein